MPLQNRVTPTGALISTPARGTLMGNRGNLHNQGKTIRRQWKSKAWIICTLKYKDVHREVMTPNSYTELFFLDEATALAAGHRPCAFCQRNTYNRFKALWHQCHGTTGFKVMDASLHQHRLTPDKSKRLWQASVATLPAGAMVLMGKQPALWSGQALHIWSAQGYTGTLPAPSGLVPVLTPEPTVALLRAGYQPQLHTSA